MGRERSAHRGLVSGTRHPRSFRPARALSTAGCRRMGAALQCANERHRTHRRGVRSPCGAGRGGGAGPPHRLRADGGAAAAAGDGPERTRAGARPGRGAPAGRSPDYPGRRCGRKGGRGCGRRHRRTCGKTRLRHASRDHQLLDGARERAASPVAQPPLRQRIAVSGRPARGLFPSCPASRRVRRATLRHRGDAAPHRGPRQAPARDRPQAARASRDGIRTHGRRVRAGRRRSGQGRPEPRRRSRRVPRAGAALPGRGGRGQRPAAAGSVSTSRSPRPRSNRSSAISNWCAPRGCAGSCSAPGCSGSTRCAPWRPATS